tara:strand:- start:2758 stop:3186 length:429 start_codon:yes stop_codon:yes gene_type:complete
VPKKPTSSLEGIRFEFNEKEREMLDSIALTQSIRNIMAGVGSILGPLAVFASTPAGIAVIGSILVAYIEREAQRIETLIANDPDSVTNKQLMNSWLWNATIGQPIDLVEAARTGDPLGFVTERLNIAKETGSRISGWLSERF